MHTNKSAGYRVLSFLLALVLTLGLFPITPAQAATNNGNGIIAAMDKEGKSVQYMQMSKANTTPLYAIQNGRKVQSVSDWFATFTDEAGNKGFGYCNDHTKPAPNNGAGANMTIKPSSYKDNTALKNVLFIGFDGNERPANFATTYLHKWVTALYGAGKVGDWSGLTDNEFKKATQLAFWMLAWGEGASRVQVSIEGQYGPGNPETRNAFEFFTNADNPSAGAQRILNTAKGIYAYATWLSSQGYDFEKEMKTGLKVHPLFADDFGRYWNADAQALDFRDTAPNGEGTLETAYEQFKDDGLIRDGGDCYIIDYVAVSGTIVQNNNNYTYIHNVTPDGVQTREYGSEANSVLGGVVDPTLLQEVAKRGLYFHETLYTPGESGILDSDPHSKAKPEPPSTSQDEKCWVCYFQVKIPKTLAREKDQEVSFDWQARVLAYRTFLAEYSADYQGFGIAATTQDLVSKSLIKWNDREVTDDTEPPGDDDDDTVLFKYGSDGKKLAGAVFHFKQIDGDQEADFETDSNGAIVLNWTSPGKDYYVNPGSYQVTEVTAPAGYNLDDSGPKTIELREDGTHSGPLIFTNTKKPTIYIYKQSDDGKPLAGAYFSVWKDGKYLGDIGPTDDATGVIEFRGVPADGTTGEGPGLENGYYEFQETFAPAGYLLNDEKKGIHVDLSTIGNHENLAVNTLVFEDVPYPEIVIIKRDKETGAVLKNASFNVRINGQDFGSTMVTDDNGEIHITYEQYKRFLTDETSEEGWTITVTEIKAPDLYNRHLHPDPAAQT